MFDTKSEIKNIFHILMRLNLTSRLQYEKINTEL